MSKLSVALDQALEELADAREVIENVAAVEVAGAHIVLTWVDYPGARVGIDAAGNAVRVELDGPRWIAESF